MTADTFPGSIVRHGTHSGWAKHTRSGERPCDPCFRAKQEYDRRRREAPQIVRLSRLHARAQHQALSALARAHKDEYDALYRQAKADLLAQDGAS